MRFAEAYTYWGDAKGKQGILCKANAEPVHAWLEWAMSSVRWPGQLWYSTCMICTAVSVLPVPGGPTTMASPGCVPALIASTCVLMHSCHPGWSLISTCPLQSCTAGHHMQ